MAALRPTRSSQAAGRWTAALQHRDRQVLRQILALGGVVVLVPRRDGPRLVPKLAVHAHHLQQDRRATFKTVPEILADRRS